MADPIGIFLLAGVGLGIIDHLVKNNPELKQYISQLLPQQNSGRIQYYRPVRVSEVLYHGTPRRAYAESILKDNMFRVKNHSPTGIYATDLFEYALEYTSGTGYVVVLENRIPSTLAVDINDVHNDPQFRTHRSGNGDDPVACFMLHTLHKRIVKTKKNVFVMVLPHAIEGQYYRVEGLEPVAIMDRKKSIIKQKYTETHTITGGCHV